ncbi:MAG: hypothetical protein OSB03_17065 [Vicinamibacterales bacterium]|nr:hypothetical protein [Vicinamibacterales bacterium]
MSAKILSSVACVALVAGCSAGNYEIPIETPLTPKLDISKFQRVLIAGFVSGGSEDVDANLETARLLRSQLRRISVLEVIDADVMPLLDIADEQIHSSARNAPPAVPDGFAVAPGAEADADENAEDGPLGEDDQMSEEELEAYETIFANVGFWRELGEEYQNPLILTGTVYFSPHQQSGMVTREREVYDSFGRRRTTPERTYRDRRGFVLSPKFIFIDGETGATVYSERHREEILYDASQNTPALSSYFELMDRLLPSVLGAFSNQSIRGTRTLLR